MSSKFVNYKPANTRSLISLKHRMRADKGSLDAAAVDIASDDDGYIRLLRQSPYWQYRPVED